MIHLAAAIRDQAAGPGRGDQRAGDGDGCCARRRPAAVRRFVFFSAIGATEFQRTRFFRAKALAERAVLASKLETTVFAPSIVYDHDDPWVTTMRRLTLLPAIPISGEGRAAFEPIWVDDVARCVLADLETTDGSRRFELAGPETLTYDQIARLIARASGRDRPLVHVPLGLVHYGLAGLRRVVGDAAFATWEEAELMEVPMISERGTADAVGLGVEPRAMAEVLGRG